VKKKYPEVQKSTNEYDCFIQKMSMSVSDCRSQYEELVEKIDKIEQEITELVSRYGLPQQTKSEELFSTIDEFSTQFHEAKVENLKEKLKKRAMQEKLDQIQELKKKRDEIDNKIKGKKTRTKGGLSRGISSTQDNQEDGNGEKNEEIVEGVLDKLKSGEHISRKTLMRKDTLKTKKEEKEKILNY